MMVLDTSVLIAILTEDKDALRYAAAISSADTSLISAASVVEAGIFMGKRHGPGGERRVSALLQEAGCRIEAVTAYHAQLAIEAYAVYGEGQGKAALNYGDCFSYALAKATGLPLLFKGGGFAETDIQPANASIPL